MTTLQEFCCSFWQNYDSILLIWVSFRVPWLGHPIDRVLSIFLSIRPIIHVGLRITMAPMPCWIPLAIPTYSWWTLLKLLLCYYLLHPGSNYYWTIYKVTLGKNLTNFYIHDISKISFHWLWISEKVPAFWGRLKLGSPWGECYGISLACSYVTCGFRLALAEPIRMLQLAALRTEVLPNQKREYWNDMGFI